MTHSSTRTKLIAAITVLAVALACVFAAIFYTRTQDALTPEDVPSGESATTFPLDYGDPVENTVPSGATAISNADQLISFINGTASYGYLTTHITLGSWPYTDRVIDSNQTLDGRGKTITIVNDRDGLDSVYNSQWTGKHIVESAAQFEQWWGNYGDNSESAKVTLPGGQKAYGVSDLASANYGTIKNLKVVMNGNSADRKDHIVTMREDGHVAMGVIAGYNAGSIINCSVTVNDKFGIVPSPYAVVGESNIQKVSYQGMTAVGGIAGYNAGNILGSSVSLNADIGIFRSQIQLRTSGVSGYGRVLSLSTESSSVGGVAGINDGGTISGINAYGGSCWVYNDAWHNQTSYSGLVVGLGNATATNATYKLSGAYGAGVDWTIRPGTINNLTLSWHSNFSFASESYATNATIDNVTDFGTRINNQAWYAVGTYVGIIGGRLGTSATNTTLANYINVYNTNFGSGRWNYNPWALDAFSAGNDSYTVNINTASGSRAVPLFGYGDGGNNYIKTVNAPTARFDGQIKAGNNTNILTQGATATYIWSGEVVDGVAYAGLLQNIDLNGIADLNGRPHNIYQFEGYAGGTRTSYKGSDNIYGADLGDSHLLRLPVYTTGGNIDLEYRYALTCTTLPDAASLDAFFGVNSGSGFGYAYANAVILNADNTVSGTVSPSGSRVFPAWKTFDGQGHSLIINSVGASVSSSATQEVGGMTFNAYGDLVSINNGTIVDVNVRFEGQGGRGDISGVSGNVAYGNIVGVNKGTLNDVKLNDVSNTALRTRVTTDGAYLALGGVAGINLGTINTVHVITWSEFYGRAQSGTFVGGVVGLNSGDGKIWNVKADGDGCTITASGGEAYVGGVLGLGENSSDATRKVVDLTVNSTLTENGTHVSPFRNWLYTGKRHVATANAYSGFLAGAVAVNATESSSNPAITGMLVLMPETSSEIGWFTGATGTPSLLGRVGSSEGYVATDLVGGANIIAADASKNYASAAVSNWNGDLNFEYSTASVYFDSDIYNNSTYVNTVNSITLQYRNMAAPSSGVSFTPNLSASRQNVSLPSTILTAGNAANEGNYAQTIALYYDYEAKIFDGAAADHPLRHFLSGETPAATYGTHNAIAAGATSAILTEDVNVNASVNGVVFEAPKTELKGNGKKITIAGVDGTLNGGAVSADYGSEHNYYGELVAINNATIDNVKIEVNGSRDLNGDNVVYGVVAGLNRGTINNTVVTVTGDVTVTSASGYNVYGMVGVNSYPSAMGVDNFTMTGAVTLDGSYSNGYLGMVGVNYAAPLTNAHATWVGSVSMTGSADYFGGLVGYAHDNQNIQNSSATFGYGGQTYDSLLDGDIYNNRYIVSLGGTDNFFGGAIGAMAGGTASSLGAVFNVDVDVTGGDSGLNDVGGLIGRITAGTATSATVSGLGALAVQGTGTIRMGGAVGEADSAPTLTDVKAMLAGGLYNRTTTGDYGWWSGYSEGGVTVNDAVFAVHDGKEYSAENAYGGSPTGTLGGGYRITDFSGNDVDYLAVNPSGMTVSGQAPVFVRSWNFGSADAVTVAVTDGTITEYTLSSSVYVYTNDNNRDEYMLRSALAGVPYADSLVTDDSDYAQSISRYYGWYAGAQTVSLTQSNEFTQDKNIFLYDTATGFVWGAGRTLEGNSGSDYKITVARAMNSNIAPQEMIWREESGDGTTEVVNSGLYAARGMFLAVNYGTVRNVNVVINGTSGGGDITIDYATVMETAEDAYPSDKQGVPGSYDGYAGVIFGMFVGVNAGTISGVNALSYDRVTTIEVTGGYEDKDLVVGGMVGAQIGADSSIGGAGTMTFGDGDGIAVTSSTGLNRISVGGWIGMVSNEDNDTSADGLEVVMKAYSFIDIDAPHNFAALGGIVGDLRGVMSDARIDTEYLSRMLVGGTRQNGTAALGNLVGVANGATIERAVVKGVGYLYNGIDENSAQQSSSVDLYSGGAIGLASNWAQDTSIATNTYKRINPSTLDSVYVDFEGYLRAVNGSKVGLITGRLFDGVTVGADGTTVTTNIDTTKLKNVVWKVNYYGDAPWASSAYIGNVSTVFNERTELAVFGYAAGTVDGYHEGLAKSGMRLWVTNNRYSGETNNEIDAEWTAVGKLKFTVTNITGATDYESFTAYFNGAKGEGGAALEGEDGITRLTTYHSLGSGAAVEASAIVDVANRLTSFTNADYSHGVYVIRFIFNEVYIYNQAELMTFITEGRNTVSNKTASTAASALTDGGTDRTGTYAAGQYGLAKTEARYNELKNADIGILANNIEVDFGATAATMPSHKTLDGQGFTVTLTANGQVTAHQMWSNRDNNASDSGPAEEYAVGNLVSEQENVRSYVSGGKEAGTTGSDYVTTDQGSSHFDATTLDQMTNTEAKVGATIGGLFMGRNLGTIANINFVLKNSVTVFNDNYGSLMVAGIVTAVNAGTIENCSLTLGANATFRAFRDNCSTKDKTNNTDYGKAGARINSVATVGGYAGMMFKYEARSANTAYIRNSTLTLESGSMITVDNEFPTYTWIGMYTSVTSYSGGLVGWMLDGGEIYNVILNGEGDVKALASFEGRDNIWNSSYMVGVAGIIVGMNAVYPVFNPIIEVGHTQDNFGYINGVICNWNGNVEYNARYSSGVGGSPADYYDANHWNYSLGGQMIGVSQTDTIQNVYFMYGVENYATYHRDNWWYGDSVAARAANESFRNKYDYVVSQSIKLLNEHPEWDAIYAPVNKNGPNGNSANNSYGDELVPVAHRAVDGEVVQGADFTFENYNNYHSADSEANKSIFKDVDYVVDENKNWGFQLYKTDLDANGQPTYYGDITRSHYHKIVELYPDTQADDDKSHDMVGARTSGRFANISTALDYSYQYAPNNVYIYEVAFGESEERELDMNDPNTVASMSFETEEITSDIRLDFELYTDENLAQFIWSIEEEWDYTPESGIPDTSNTTDYYNTVNSLEEAMANNKFDRTMRRDNDSVNIRITYWVGSAVAIAPDLERYDTVMTVGEDENGETVVESLTYYDTQPYIYDGSELTLPTLYYVSYTDPTIKVLDDPAVLAENMFDFYKLVADADGNLQSPDRLSGAPRDAGEYYIRLLFEDETGADTGLKVNTSQRTVMFGVGTDYYDFYTAILPSGISGVSVTKVYDGTDKVTGATFTYTASPEKPPEGFLIGGSFAGKDQGEQRFTADDRNVMFFRTVNGSGTSATVSEHKIMLISDPDGNATNFAVVGQRLSDGKTVAADIDGYYYSDTVRFTGSKSTITPYKLTLDDFTFLVTDGAGVEWRWTDANDRQVEYRHDYYYTEAAFAGSTVNIAGAASGSTTFDRNGVISGMLADDDRVTLSYLFGRAESVRDKGEYETTITLVSTNGNYVLEPSSLNIGTLIITEIVIQETSFVYSMEDIFRTYDGTKPDATAALFGGTLTVTDPNGYVLNTDDATYKLTYTINGDAIDVSEDGYTLTVTVSHFESNNYTLPNGVTSFPINIENARLYITPKLIEFKSIVKQYDGSGAQTDGTVFTYVSDNAPIAADEGIVFLGAFDDYLISGPDKDFVLDATAVDIGGTDYTVLAVKGDADNLNYYVEDASPAVGGITPVKVEIASVTMLYSGRSYFDYNSPYNTQIVINGLLGDMLQVGGEFVNARVGENKQVTMDVGRLDVGNKTYNILKASKYESASSPNSNEGDNFPGNYYVDDETIDGVGLIYQYTIEGENFSITITQTVSGKDFTLGGASLGGGGKFTYRRGNEFSGSASEGSNWGNEDEIAEIIDVAIARDGGDDGNAGTYVVTLTIVGVDGGDPDYTWADDLGASGGELTFKFTVERQTVDTTASAVVDSGASYVYNGGSQDIEISASVSDKDGNKLTLEPSVSDATNATLGGSYSMNDTLPIGDYAAEVGVELSAEDEVNYEYTGGETSVEFAVTPKALDVTRVEKEFDNTVATDTADNVAEFAIEGFADSAYNENSFVGEAVYRDPVPQTNGEVLFPIKSYTIGGTRYDVLTIDDVQINHFIDGAAREDGYSVVGGVGVIDKYAIGSGEVTTYIYGWLSGAAEKSMRVATEESAVFEYRAGATYTAADVVFDLDLRYGFADGDVPSGTPQIGDITALSFTVTISGDAELPGVGKYTISVSLDNAYFTLDQDAANGVFEIVKQSVSGGSQDPDNPDAGFVGGNVFITAALYSKRYGEEGYAGPAVGDQTVVLTVTVTDKYDQTTRVPFDKTVVTSLLYGVDEGSRAAQIAGVDGLFVGEYLVWATAFTEELGNYAIPTDAVIPVFPEGTPPPQTDEEGNVIGAQHTAVYAITPAAVEITSVDKTYDGTTSFTGAKITAAPQEVAAAITGSYLSPDATHASDGVTRIEGQGNTSVVINTTALRVQNTSYNMIATSGVAGNYCVQGAAAEDGVQVDNVAIIRRLVIADESAVTITSQKFAKPYDATADVVIPPEGISMEMTVSFPEGEDGTTPAPLNFTLTPTAEGLIFLGADGVPLEAAPTDVGAYGVALAPVGMGNFELPSGVNVRVTPTEPHAEGDSAIYYIEPVELTIRQLSKTYDGTAALTESTVFVAAVPALNDVTVTRDMIAVAFDTPDIGIGKSALVSVVSFTLADGTTVYRVLGADGVTPTNFCVQGTLSDSGAAVAVTAPADAEAPFTIAPAPLTLNAGTVTKTYDGTTAITTAPTAAFTGFVNGETIAPDWYYDGADAGTRNVLVRVDNSTAYTVGDVTYYAVMTAGEEGAMGVGNYGIDSALAAPQTVWVTDPESGELTAVEQWYAVFAGGGRIDKFVITGITGVEVNGAPIEDVREYDRTFNDRVDFVVNFGDEGTVPGRGTSSATVTAPFSQTSVSEENGSQTSTKDSLRFRLRWNADPGNVGTYTLTIELDSSYGSAGNYSMSDYTGTLVIVPKELDGVFAVIAQLTKEYDGTTNLPTLDRAMVTFYGVDGNDVLLNNGKFMLGEGGGIAFVDAEGMPLEGDALPVNVLIGEDGTIGGYEFRLTGVVFNDTNYVWDTGTVTRIYVSYDAENGYGAQTLYTITPKELTVDAGSLTDKTFDGAFSLSVETGVDGEYAIVGDANGAVGALAGVYSGVTIVPTVIGVTFDSSAPNPTTTADNYTIADGGVTIESLTIGTGNVLTAERVLRGYRIGFGGMAGLDFLVGAGADAAAIAALVATAESGEPLHADGYTSGDPVALLNAALISLFEVKLNTAPVTLEGGKLYFNDFLWSAVTDGMGRTTHSLTFSFTGIDGYDEDGYATDRYEFVLKGATAADVPSTNASLTSSELAPGQLAAATQTAGTAIATADDLLAFLEGGSGSGYLTADIYGFDAAGKGVTFGGTLYGNGHTIQLTPSDLAAAQSGGYDAYGALVAVNNGTISDVNLKLMGCDLAFEQSSAVFGAVGVNNGDLVNVSVEVVGTLNIDGAQYAGALTAVNTGTITDCAATVSGAVNMTSTSGETVTQSGTFGGLAGFGGGAMTRVAAYGSGSVSAADGGAIVGAAYGLTIDGVIAAAAWGVKGVVGSGTPTKASGLYVNTAADLGVTADALGIALSLLTPHTEGFIQYYFTSEGDFTSGGARHNEFGSAGETNRSGYRVYADDLTAVIAVEAIAPAGRYVWEGYGINYRTVGTALNRVVGVFALGSSLSDQYDETATITPGVGAFTVALGIYGSTVVAEDTSSVKEVVYNGQPQSYKVTLTIDGTETEIEVTGTDVGYYSRSFVEGIISGSGETVGNITFDDDGRVAITVTGGGSSVADGIALIIYPKTSSGTAEKYYDGNSAADVVLTDGEGVIGGGVYLDAEYVKTKNAADATQVSIVNATTAVRTVAVDEEGNFVALITAYETVDGQLQAVVKIVPVTIETQDADVPFGLTTDITAYTSAQIMRAYVMLTDFADLEEAAEGGALDISGYHPASVLAITASLGGEVFDEEAGAFYFAPQTGNYIVTSTDWTLGATTIAAGGYDWSTAEKYTVPGTINPINLNIGVTISGADQSYNHPIVEPTTNGGAATVGMGFDEAAEKYDLTKQEYDLLVSQTGSIKVAAVSGMFKQLVEEDKLVDNGDGTYSAAVKKYQQFTIATSGGGTDSSGNFIVGASGMLTLRYFEPEIVDGKTTYLLGSLDDWRALQSNENGAADYNTLDYKLSADIDFGGEGAMLAWRDADEGMLAFTGTLDGGEYVLSNIFEFNEGNGAKSALIESIGEGGVVSNLTVVDSVFDAFGDNTVTAGIAIDNHGTIENCTFEGTLAGGSKTAGAATLAGLVANNFGTVKGGTAVADGLIFAAESGKTDAVGIAFNRDNAETETAASVESSNAVAAIRAYGGASGALGGAVAGSNAGGGNGYVQGLATRNGAAVADGDTSSAKIVWSGNASIKSVIESYVFNSELVSYDGSKLDTDNFRKLIAAIRLFEFVGTADVTHQSASAWGKYAAWLAAHALN